MRIIIAGSGEVGSHLAQMLCGPTNDITIIDSDTTRLENIAAVADIVGIEGSPTSMKILSEAGVRNADLFIAVFPLDNQDINVVSAILAKKMGCRKVMARVNNEEYLDDTNRTIFEELGIDILFYPEKIAAEELMGLLAGESSIDSLDVSVGKLQMGVYKLENESPITDITVQEFARKVSGSKVQFRVVAISRRGEAFIPKFDTRFKYNDTVFILSTSDGLKEITGFIGEDSVEVRSVMILGGTRIAAMVSRMLVGKGYKVKIVDSDRKRCDALAEELPEKVSIVLGNGQTNNFLIDENILSYDAFVSLTDSSEVNILSCVAAKRLGVRRTVAQVENIEYISLAEGMGVDGVINKKLLTAGNVFKYTLSDKVRFVKYLNGTEAEMIEFIAAHGSKITKGRLKDIDFPEGAIIGGVMRGDDAFIAVGDTQIQESDRVTVFTMPQNVREIDKWFK